MRTRSRRPVLDSLRTLKGQTMLTQFIIDAETTAQAAFNALGTFADKHQQGDFYNAARILAEVRHAAVIMRDHPDQRQDVAARLLELFE